MRDNTFLIDSNVFLQILLHTPESEESKDFLDRHSDQCRTSIYNLMEIISVLSRKYHWKRPEIEDVISVLKDAMEIYVPDEYDSLNAYELTYEYLLTPIDSLLLSIAQRERLTLITYDKGLLQYHKKICDIKRPK